MNEVDTLICMRQYISETISDEMGSAEVTARLRKFIQTADDTLTEWKAANVAEVERLKAEIKRRGGV